VVKFTNNPQGSRILVNELLGARLAALLGLPVAQPEIIEVPKELIRLTPEMVIQLGRGRMPCQAGRCFGSRLPLDPRRGTMHDSLPDHLLRQLQNLEDFLGMLVFDSWTCNTDGRQVVYFRADGTPKYQAVMIDHGFCFNANEWNFPDSPLRGQYYHRIAYENVQGMASFEPWLNRLETEIDEVALLTTAEDVPLEWYESRTDSLQHLLDKLNRRRGRVRELLLTVGNSYRRPFPNWLPLCRSLMVG
jgi:hypothetical protein